MSNETRFTYFSADELATLKELVSQRVDQWAREWLADARFNIVEMVNLVDRDDIAPSGEQIILDCEGSPVKIMVDPTVMLGRLLCIPAYQSEDICKAAEFLGEKCFLALFSQLAGQTREKYRFENELPARLSWLGTGWVACSVLLDDIPMTLLLGEEILRSAVPVPDSKRLAPDLINRSAAISDAPVSLKAVFGNIELSLGNFSSLQEGDVLSLSVPIEAPVSLVNDSDDVVCEGYLGASEAHRVVRVTG